MIVSHGPLRGKRPDLKASASAAGSLKFEDLRIGGFEDIRILYKFSVNMGTLEAVLERPNRRGRVFPYYLIFRIAIQGAWVTSPSC